MHFPHASIGARVVLYDAKLGGYMDEFIERMLKARRTLDQALTDLVAKCNRIPRSKERCMLERMTEILNDEISIRRNRSALLSKRAR